MTSGLQTGQLVQVQGAGWLVSQLTVTGTSPSAGQLVFHIAASEGASVVGGTSAPPASGGSIDWSLRLFGTAPDATTFSLGGGQTAAADGTVTTSGFGPGVQQTGTGFNVFVPLSTGTYTFDLVSSELGYAAAQPPGAIFSAFLNASVTGVDAVTSSGAVLGSATFNSSTGFGTLNLSQNGGGTTTAPEPSSVALLGSGLVGLAPIARRSRRERRPLSE